MTFTIQKIQISLIPSTKNSVLCTELYSICICFNARSKHAIDIKAELLWKQKLGKQMWCQKFYFDKVLGKCQYHVRFLSFIAFFKRKMILNKFMIWHVYDLNTSEKQWVSKNLSDAEYNFFFFFFFFWDCICFSVIWAYSKVIA